MKKNPSFNVHTESELLSFLLKCFDNKSRNYVKGILKRGQVTIDGNVCTNHAHRLQPGQQVDIILQTTAIRQNKMNLPIIYEDDDIIVIDKPAGMLAVSTEKEQEHTAFHIVNEYIKSRNKAGRIFIVHRLDRETSGIMLLAKSERIKHTLQDNWNNNVIRRGYIAVVEGHVQPPQRRIMSWLKQTKSLLVYSSAGKDNGKLAITNYQVMQTSATHSLLDISLETGRKNQIRVHMKDIGHPIVGDKKYGAHTDPLARLGLHASVLIINHPSSNEQLRLESAMPSTFMSLFGMHK